MTSKVFIDTNILVYSVDKADKKKQIKSRALLKKILYESIGVISTQILQEFYIVAVKKMDIAPLDAKKLLHSYENFETISITPGIIKEAIDCSIIDQISFWDALVVVTAESAKCDVLFTEDLNHGRIIRGIKIINPFVN